MSRNHHGRASRAVFAALALTLAGCGGSSAVGPGTTSAPGTTASTSGSATPTGSAAAAAAVAAVKTAWVTFFAGTTSAATKISLLENGQQFTQVIDAQAGSALAKGTTAKVIQVTQTSPSTADVNYTILINGQPALQNQLGRAVLVNGEWKVGANSFCALLALEGTKVAACPATG